MYFTAHGYGLSNNPEYAKTIKILQTLIGSNYGDVMQLLSQSAKSTELDEVAWCCIMRKLQ